MITGSVRVDGAPAADRRVLAVSAGTPRLLASASTGADGNFRLPVDERPVHVVVKLQGPEVGAVVRTLDGGAGDHAPVDVAIDTAAGGFHRVRAVLDGESRPPFVLLTLDPLHLDGVPPEVEPFLNRRDHAVVEASYFDAPVRGDELEVLAQSGRYRLRGGYVVKARPVVAGPTDDVVVVSVVDDDTGAPLPGDSASGFDLAVTGPRRLRLTLAPPPTPTSTST